MISLLLRANQLSSLRQLLQKKLSNSQENIALLNRITIFPWRFFSRMKIHWYQTYVLWGEISSSRNLNQCPIYHQWLLKA